MIAAIGAGVWAFTGVLAYFWMQHVNDVDFHGDYRGSAIVAGFFGPVGLLFALGYWLGHIWHR